MSHYRFLKELIAIDSPTGYTDRASQYVFDALSALGYQPRFTKKGAAKCALGDKPQLSIAAHVDTLGAIVSGIKENGHLSFSLLGGLSLNMAEGAYCKIHTMEAKTFTGTLLLNNPSVHANRKVGETKRSADDMHIRLDERVTSKADTLKRGIRVGDIISVNPNYEELPNGFIKSRFLDNKAGCYVLYEIARRLKEAGTTAPVELFFSNYEEIGHGASSGHAATIEEMLVIDMGVLGDACQGDEYSCSICAKDSTGPYDYGLRKTLVQLAESHNIAHKIDVYPYYGSDGSAALRAGYEIRVGLIGPGVAASHGVERTHKDAIEATIALSLAYIRHKFVK